jgi:hypothetical protein
LDRCKPEYVKAVAQGTPIADSITKESMEKVVVSMILTAQWDVKWDNVIVGNNEARPIDGGAAMPNRNIVDYFINARAMFPQMSDMAKYPKASTKAGQPLPFATQPLDPTLVAQLKGLTADNFIAVVKARRQQLLQNVPAMNTSVPLVDDECFAIQKASIEAAQAILNADVNGDMTLLRFTEEYEAWFPSWGPRFLSGN